MNKRIEKLEKIHEGRWKKIIISEIEEEKRIEQITLILIIVMSIISIITIMFGGRPEHGESISGMIKWVLGLIF